MDSHDKVLAVAHRIQKMKEIFLHSIPIKEHQIVEQLVPRPKEEVMKITPVQKQTRAGQRTRFKVFMVVGDGDDHIDLDVKCAKAKTIFGTIILAMFFVVPVADKCGYVTVRMMLPPMGSSIMATRVPKKVLQFAGIEDIFTSSRGSKTLGNFVKASSIHLCYVKC
uniref:S5 DRBM domain-containing protein n=1 Tax=Oryza barthii TaxID=65489 RepID=A0A0D3GQ61_9ORYZ